MTTAGVLYLHEVKVERGMACDPADPVKIIRSLRHKRCADGSLKKLFELSAPIHAGLLSFFREFGEIRTFRIAGEDWFSFTWPQMIEVRGRVGDDEVEVQYTAGVDDLVDDSFHLLLWYYREGRDVNKLRAIERTIREKMRTRLGNGR